MSDTMGGQAGIYILWQKTILMDIGGVVYCKSDTFICICYSASKETIPSDSSRVNVDFDMCLAFCESYSLV
jgi:hypothetical protein